MSDLTKEELAGLQAKWAELPNDLEMYQSEAVDVLQATPQLIVMAKQWGAVREKLDALCGPDNLIDINVEEPEDWPLVLDELIAMARRTAEAERLSEAKDLLDDVLRTCDSTAPVVIRWLARRAALDESEKNELSEHELWLAAERAYGAFCTAHKFSHYRGILHPFWASMTAVEHHAWLCVARELLDPHAPEKR